MVKGRMFTLLWGQRPRHRIRRRNRKAERKETEVERGRQKGREKKRPKTEKETQINSNGDRSRVGLGGTADTAGGAV